MSQQKIYELKESSVIIDGQVYFITDDAFNLLMDLSEERDELMRERNSLQRHIDIKIFYNQLN